MNPLAPPIKNKDARIVGTVAQERHCQRGYFVVQFSGCENGKRNTAFK